MHITQRLVKNTAPENAALGDRLYDDLMKRVSEQALKDARQEVRLEVAKHLADVVRMEAEVLSANSKAEAAIRRNDSFETLANDSHDEVARLREKVVSLDRALMTVKSSWTATKEQLANSSQDVKSELITEQLKTEQLKLKVASLEGQLKESKSVKPVSVAQQVKIPAFKFDPVRGPDGRIQTLTATPQWSN